MFKHLLVPVDGSDVSKKSLKKVAELAKADKASVTLVYVSDPMPPMVYSDSTMGYGISQKDHKKVCEGFAQDVLVTGQAQNLAGDTAGDNTRTGAGGQKQNMGALETHFHIVGDGIIPDRYAFHKLFGLLRGFLNG